MLIYKTNKLETFQTCVQSSSISLIAILSVNPYYKPGGTSNGDLRLTPPRSLIFQLLFEPNSSFKIAPLDQ